MFANRISSRFRGRRIRVGFARPWNQHQQRSNAGVQGISTNNIAVLGSSINAIGIGGVSNNGDAVYAKANAGHFAGKFDGDVQVNGNLSKASGSFKIDHPIRSMKKRRENREQFRRKAQANNQ